MEEASAFLSLITLNIKVYSQVKRQRLTGEKNMI